MTHRLAASPVINCWGHDQVHADQAHLWPGCHITKEGTGLSSSGSGSGRSELLEQLFEQYEYLDEFPRRAIEAGDGGIAR